MRWFGKTWGTRPATARRVRPPAWVQADATATQAEDDAPPRGCAWFDSSHELRTGLLVREMRPGPELQGLLRAPATCGDGGT